jgi:hypothetical protein
MRRGEKMSALLSKIYRLKGIIDSMETMAEFGSEYEHPMLDTLSSGINEIIEETEKISVGE